MTTDRAENMLREATSIANRTTAPMLHPHCIVCARINNTVRLGRFGHELHPCCDQCEHTGHMLSDEERSKVRAAVERDGVSVVAANANLTENVVRGAIEHGRVAFAGWAAQLVSVTTAEKAAPSRIARMRWRRRRS